LLSNWKIKMECQRIRQTYLNSRRDMNVLFWTDSVLEALVSENDKILVDLIGRRIKAYEVKKRKKWWI
jgi:hypothetical protein